MGKRQLPHNGLRGRQVGKAILVEPYGKRFEIIQSNNGATISH